MPKRKRSTAWVLQGPWRADYSVRDNKPCLIKIRNQFDDYITIATPDGIGQVALSDLYSTEKEAWIAKLRLLEEERSTSERLYSELLVQTIDTIAGLNKKEKRAKSRA